MKKEHYIAMLMVICACAFWSGNIIIARGIYETVPPFALSFWRWTVALLFVIPLAHRTIQKEWSHIIKHWKYIVVMGALGVASFNTLIYIAAKYTSAGNMAIILSTGPLFTIVFSILTGADKLSTLKSFGMMVAFAGAVIMVTRGEYSNLSVQEWNIGDIMVLIANVIWAIWNVALHHKPKNISSMSLISTTTAVGCITLLPFYLWETTYTEPFAINIETISAFLYLGIFASVISWSFWNHAITVIGVIKSSILYYSMPVFSSILSIIILDEIVEKYHLYGFLCIFIGMTITNLQHKEQKL